MKTIQDWSSLFPESARLYQAAKAVLPGGLTHDSRITSPFPIYMNRAIGSRKWDVDGFEYVDYWMGHGALMLGHSYPPVLDAVAHQLSKGTHLGACHELEVKWASLVKDMVPCADLVRFCSSGTEATQLAIRLARAFTKNNRIIRFHDHFHGWHDYAVWGWKEPYDTGNSPGVPKSVGEVVTSIPSGDIGALVGELQRGDVAGALIEPTGASFGSIPLPKSYLHKLRETTAEFGCLLILDEVVSGFRLAPGGAQEALGVGADLCTLGKALGGGLPAAAVAGSEDIMMLLSADGWRGLKVPHQGTFNGNPLSATAGVAALSELRSGEVQERASSTADLLRRECNAVYRDTGVAGAAYGIGSLFHLHLGNGVEVGVDGQVTDFDPRILAADTRGNMRLRALRSRMLTRGVDLMRSGGMVSAAHDAQDVAVTTAALSGALVEMMDEGLLDDCRRDSEWK